MAWMVLSACMALCLFWAVGAHNRLVRLRGDVVRQWASVDAVWLRLVVRMQAGITARQTLAEENSEETLSLQSACEEFLEVLSLVRLQALEPQLLKQLMAQHQKLVTEIRQAIQHGSAGIQPDLIIALNRMRQMLPAALIPYHVAVNVYNQAVTMWPAAWLAKRLKFTHLTKVDLGLGGAD